MKLSDLRPGDRITGFRDFGCIPDGAVRIVRRDAGNNLYVRCGDGVHLLDGQQDAAGELVGLSKVTS
jgi:hypothetical protein